MPAQIWILLVQIGILLAVIAVVVVVYWNRLRKERSKPTQSAEPERIASQEEIDEAISGWVGRKLREGFDTRQEIIQGVTENIDDEYEAEDVQKRVARETDRQFEEYLKNQLSWPEQTDCDRIDAALAALEGKGIVARQNFACCQTCGLAEIEEEIEEFAKTADPVGYTFYHMQDTERACDGGSLYLAYGTVGGTDEEAVKIGETIRDTLTQHGLTVEWDGSVGQKICITGLDWKRRRKRE